MAGLTKSTVTVSSNPIPLQCDVYDACHYPLNNPVFLFFHAGGLVGGSRALIPPWLVQVCYKQQWPLISGSYRLLPQACGRSLLEDVTLLYEFARRYKTSSKRGVVVGGASAGTLRSRVVHGAPPSVVTAYNETQLAGAFLAALIGHHLDPPLALLSISGILTFQHSFFNSSTLLTSSLIANDKATPFLNGPLVVGTSPSYDPWTFHTEMLQSALGSKNPSYIPSPIPQHKNKSEKDEETRRQLYELFVHCNRYNLMLGDVDPGFKWAELGSSKWLNWPPTVIITGDKDTDVDKDVSITVARYLREKAKLFVAHSQPHMFEATNYLEDGNEGMDVVREAVSALVKCVGGAKMDF